MKDYKLIIGLALILIGLVGHKAPDYLNRVKDAIFKNSVRVVDIKPEDAILNKSKKVSSLVTDKNDRLQLAIFHLQFANRLDTYFDINITSQQIIDIYTESVKNYFSNKLIGKYDGLSDEMQLFLESSVGSVDHILSKDELTSLKYDLIGISWNLSNQ